MITTRVRGTGAARVRVRVTRDGRPARFAHLTAADADGGQHDVRADGHGRVDLGDLAPGTWTLTARDPRGLRCSEPLSLTVDPDRTVDADLDLTTETARLLVRVRGADRRPVRAAEVVVVDASGRRVTAPLRDGLADLRGLQPGPLTLLVPLSLGHLGARVELPPVAPGAMATCRTVVAIGATLAGRVVQGRRAQYAAGVALLDADGVEIERARTDRDGRFELGTGLRTTAGLTVVATSGPETLHVTRAACADVQVFTGVRHHLGDLVLPVAGLRAVWTALTPPVSGMTHPSTRV